jgi:hypothetical protein
MQLDTDYEQWYDGIFDPCPPVFHRRAFSRGGLSKRAQFDLFASLNLRTPPHGPVSELSARMLETAAGASIPECFGDDLRCVVYLDPYAHTGEGKTLVSLREAASKYPDHYASLFVPSRGAPLVYRLARFGQWAFWLRQEGGSEDWRSNRQDSECVLTKQRAADPNPIPRVLWAIDFVPSPLGLLALDFNTAPQLATLGETGALTAVEVAAELHEAANRNLREFDQF